MKNESDIIGQIRKAMRDLLGPVPALKLRFERRVASEGLWRPDFVARVTHNASFRIVGGLLPHGSLQVFKDRISLLKQYAEKNENSVPMIAAPYLSPEKRENCRKAGVCFLDLSGNLFLAYGGLHIERTGFPNRFPEKRKGRSPFSDKASLILRAALPDGKRLWGVRELARELGLNPGFVSRTVRELEKRSYVTRLNSKFRLRNPENILKDWTRKYDYEKNKDAGYFCLVRHPDDIMEKIRKADVPENIRYALGLQAGANLVSPYAAYSEVHIYVRTRDDIAFFVDKLKLRQADQGPNIIFLLPYYKHSVFYGKQKVSGVWAVSDIQLYLDLCKYPIRGAEQAEHLYEKRLRDRIGDRHV